MDWALFGIFLLGCMAAGSTGAVFSPDEWYRDELEKPSWTPPDWVFPVAWITLYILIALAATRVAGLPGAEYALGLWALQMVLNALWSPIFFGSRKIQAALIAVVALWLGVMACMVSLFTLDWVAGLMFVPYLVWVTIAASLNFWIWRHNDDRYAQAAPAE